MTSKTSVFIDGSHGTTGIDVLTRLGDRDDLEIVTLPRESAKDPDARREALRASEFAVLCLPDDASREAVALAQGSRVRIIDASTAHRTDPSFTYGLPEISPQARGLVASSARLSVPGCHATGFVMLMRPLVDAGLADPGEAVSCFSLTGYSGGGKAMIAEYEAPDRSPLLAAPRIYALGQSHKHLPEMRLHSGLAAEPVFSPVVADFYSGMIVTVPVPPAWGASKEALLDAYAARYAGEALVSVSADADGEDYYSACALSGTDRMQITVCGSGGRLSVSARFDNLGKGACGAAVQCLNLMTGAPELKGVRL